MKRHWDTGNVLLGMAAIVDPRHKSLEWLKPHQQHIIQQQLLGEMFAVAKIPYLKMMRTRNMMLQYHHDQNILVLKTVTFLTQMKKRLQNWIAIVRTRPICREVKDESMLGF